MKKFMALVLVLALAFAFAACSGNTDNEDVNNVNEQQQDVADGQQEVQDEQPEDEGSGLVILDESLAPEEYGIGFRKEDEALCYAVEAALSELKAQGKLAEISEKWFGEDKIVFESDADIANVGLTTLPGTLKLGLDASFPPLGYTDDQNNIVGFDIDLAQAVCDFYSMELECVPIIWDNKDIELQSGNIDCIWNGFTINEERSEKYCMSKPYLANRQVVVVAEGSGINSLTDLAGKRVALQSDSSASDALEANEEVNASIAEKVELTDNLAALMELKSGSVDAVIMDEVVARYVISNQM